MQVIKHLISYIGKIQGIGPRVARKAALHIIKNRQKEIPIFKNLLEEIYKNVCECENCFNLDIKSPCSICTDEGRDSNMICIVEGVDDLWAVERSNHYKGKYFVLGGALCAGRGIGPEDLRLNTLVKVLKARKWEEVIIALSPTPEGQITANYIKDLVKEENFNITEIAQGVPLGAHFDYLDDATIVASFLKRG